MTFRVARSLLLLALLLGVARDPIRAEEPARDARPNILFVLTDDHAVRAVGTYGSYLNRTPHIDRLAREGVVFERAYCGNAICAPSRASILTGLHSHAHGLCTNQDRFDGSQPTFASLLQGSGYQTALVGKWHLACVPEGFDHWEILPGQGSYYNPDFKSPSGQRRHPGYVTDVTTDLALAWLRSREGENGPFLLLCHHKAPHRTWSPGPDHVADLDDLALAEPPTLFDDYAGRNSLLPKNEMTIGRHLMEDYDLKLTGSRHPDALGRRLVNPELARMTTDQRRRWDAAYGPRNERLDRRGLSAEDFVRWKYQRYVKDYLRCVASVDDGVGRLLDYLDETGLASNTIVIYASDQGFFLGEHGLYDKRWMYEESMRLPLLVRWPGVAKPGARVRDLVQTIDLAPTLLEAAGVEGPDRMQGESLVGLLSGEVPATWRHALYYHYYELGEHAVPRHEGVRTSRYKLIHYYDAHEWELFDLQQDPQELHSRHADTVYADRRRELEAELEALRTRYEVPAR
jgi:N-acetylglucosamine-6-sulfatase